MGAFHQNYQTTDDLPAGYVSKRIDFDNFLVEKAKQAVMELEELAKKVHVGGFGFAIIYAGNFVWYKYIIFDRL